MEPRRSAGRIVFALTVPGIGPVLRDQAKALGLQPDGVEFDGRADVVSFGWLDWDPLQRLRTAEDVFIQVADLRPAATAARTLAPFHARDLTMGLDRLASMGVHLGRAFNVVARVTDERRFRRSTFRDALAAHLGAMLPRWRPRSTAMVEVWALQVAPDRFRIGLRLPTLGTRADRPRPAERPGSLRPAVAAAMVHLAGQPAGLLFDPCCGSGTILVEAARAGWHVGGGDLDPGAVIAAATNTARSLVRLDCRQLPLAPNAARAVVTNVPFGVQHQLQGSPVAWYRRALTEAKRLAPTIIVMAAPSRPFRQALGRLPFDIRSRHDITLLGRPATIWALEDPRRDRPQTSTRDRP